MDIFTISDIENLSGIKAHTLRIWEKRYSILKPKRRKSRHRYYDNEDLKKILLVAELNRDGLKISRIAKLPEEQLRTLSLAKKESSSGYESYISQMAEACMELNEEKLNQSFTAVFSHMDMEKLVLNIFIPLLERLGTNWLNDRTRPVQEHFASNFISRKILMAIGTLQVPDSGALTILFTPEGEYHEIPHLFTWYLLKKRGKRVAYFGSGVQLNTIKEFTQVKKAGRLHFHLITNLTSHTPDDFIKLMLTIFPEQEIVVSGPLAAAVTISDKRLKRILSLQELLMYCEAD